MADAAPERDGSGDDTQRKFREALERKRAKQADANAARGGAEAGKARGGVHGPARNRRSFRRRSGG